MHTLRSQGNLYPRPTHGKFMSLPARQPSQPANDYDILPLDITCSSAALQWTHLSAAQYPAIARTYGRVWPSLFAVNRHISESPTNSRSGHYLGPSFLSNSASFVLRGRETLHANSIPCSSVKCSAIWCDVFSTPVFSIISTSTPRISKQLPHVCARNQLVKILA